LAGITGSLSAEYAYIPLGWPTMKNWDMQIRDMKKNMLLELQLYEIYGIHTLTCTMEKLARSKRYWNFMKIYQEGKSVIQK
jgi:hypothetical protein